MQSKSIGAACALAAALALLAPAAHADTNVALGGAVSLNGAGFGNSDGWADGALAAAGSVTDGVLLPIQQQWNVGSVFWTGDYGADTITVTLGQAAVVNGLMVEGDNDNDYGIRYRDTAGAWHDLAIVSPNRSWGEDVGNLTLGAPVTATAFEISGAAGSGDNHFSVAEFQAYGTAIVVPEPASPVLLLAGLGALAMIRRRRARA